nr:hypothetical protein [Anaerolineae bacterium]
MVIGVNGVGKTTTIAKLGKQFKDQGLKVLFVAAGFIWHGMSGFDHFQTLRRHAIAVAGDDEPIERTVPCVFQCFGHGARRLARTDNDGAAL